MFLASSPTAECLSGEDRCGKDSLALAALAVVGSEEVVQAVAVALVCLWVVPLVAEVVGIWVDAQKANETVQLPHAVLQQHEGCEIFVMLQEWQAHWWWAESR